MILRFILLVLTLFLTACLDDGGSKSTISQSKQLELSLQDNLSSDFLDWQKSSSKTTELIPSPISVEVLDSTIQDNILRAANLKRRPSKYSMRDTYISPVKNQGQCGVCWAFATYGALEGSYEKESFFDFSEDHLKHLNAYDVIENYGACSGGNIWKSLAYLSNFKGVVDEIFDPYAVSQDSEYCLTCKPSRYIDNAVFVPSRRDIYDNDVIKSILYEKRKPLYATLQVGFGSAGESSDSIYEASTFSFYQKNSNSLANHAVVIVGWDDDYIAQGQKGAYIVKNSWGSAVGDSGYYYIPYSDKTIGFGELVYFEDTDDNLFKFDNLYSYDELGTTASISINSQTIQMTNVFQAKEDESIVGASFFTLDSKQNVEIEVHQVISQNPLVTQKIGNTLYSANSKMRGFYSVKFPLQIDVKKDDLFAIVVRFTSDANEVVMPVEAKLDAYASNVSALAKQSYYRIDTQWEDLTDVRADLNFPIKAMTINKDNQAPSQLLHVRATDTKVLKDENITFTAYFDSEDIDILSLTWNFGDNSTATGNDVVHSFSSSNNYTVNVLAVGSDSKTYSSSIDIDVLNTATSTLADANLSFYENAKAGDKVGSIPINFSGTTTIILSGSGSELFTVEPNGDVFVAKNASFDYEKISKYSLTAISIDGPGVDTNVDVNIDVLNVNEFTPVLANFTTYLAENSPVGTKVGRVSIVSSGDSSITSMQLSGSGASNFTITSAGVINVSATASLDYETIKKYTLSVTATNNAGTSTPASVIINLSNVPETLPVLSDLTTNVQENSIAGTTVGSIGIVSTGDTPITLITLSGGGSDDFVVDNLGVIKVAPSISIDFERQSIYSLTANATNAKGTSESVNVNINVVNIPEIKPIIENFAANVVENIVQNTLLGTISILQVGDTPISSMSLSGVGASDFLLSSDGNITVGVANLDYERQKLYTLNAVATNAAGSSNSVSVEITLTDAPAITTALIKANDATADDYFSNAISLDNDRVLSGAFREDSGGSAYLYIRNSNGSYSQSVKIISSDIQPDDSLGFDVSMDGNLIVLGAPKEDENGSDAGAVYLFKYFEVDQSALELVKLRSQDTVAGDHFGSAVYISGDLVLVGAPEHNSTGAVYLYKYSSFDNSLTQKVKFTASSLADGVGFGSEVRMDDNKILVATSSGEAAYLFTYNNIDDTIEEIYTFVSSDNQPGDLFGSQIDMRLNSMIIGSPGSDSAYLYRYNGSSVAPYEKKITVDSSGSGVKFSSDVAISETKVLIGSVNEDSVYLYNYNESTFNLEIPGMKFSVDSLSSGSEIGSEVALNGTLFALGATKEDSVASNSGAIFIVDTEAQNRPYLINYTPQIDINENTITIFTCSASSVNGSSITYSLSGVDADVFTISSSGIIRASSLDYENPTDVGADNSYNIIIDLEDLAGMKYSYPMKIDVQNISE
jgi:C1A family cysteine protease